MVGHPAHGLAGGAVDRDGALAGAEAGAVLVDHTTASAEVAKELAEAAYKQMKMLPMYSSAIHRTVPAVMELTERIAALSPVKNPRIYFSTTGSEANDHLLKFMWYGNGFAAQRSEGRAG